MVKKLQIPTKISLTLEKENNIKHNA